MSGVLPYHHYLLFLPEFVPGSSEDKWVIIVDRASLLIIQALSGLQKLQEQSWRLLELHSLKIVSSGIIWVSLQEVGYWWHILWKHCETSIYFAHSRESKTLWLTGFSDELALPGLVGVCTPVLTVTAFGIQHLCCLGLCHGGVQDVLPAQSYQTPRLLLQLHSCEYP